MVGFTLRFITYNVSVQYNIFNGYKYLFKKILFNYFLLGFLKVK